ncbi:MAG: zinc dependent phospholipase C family protein [Dehalococcoidia bacterium]
MGGKRIRLQASFFWGEGSLLPPICYHLGVAEEAASRLRHPTVDQGLGSFYLGCTAPDIRFFIGTSREETHFFSLDSDDSVSGVSLLFETYPELRGDAKLNIATKSFVAGYLSHLVTDEAWICRIYRPFFGKASSLGRSPVANLFDRLLQFEIDRRERLSSANISTIRKELADSTSGVAVSFIDELNLNRWSEFVFISTTRRPHWEDFRSFAENYLIGLRQIGREPLEAFFASFDARLQEVLEMVPEERLEEFHEQSVADTVRVVREYLG